MIYKLLSYYFEIFQWQRMSVIKIQKMQLKRFKQIFEFAKEHSKFYNQFYKDAGVYNLEIKCLEDINKIPIINKRILRQYSTTDIMTQNVDNNINIHSTSGSTGEPFKIAFNKFEDYTAHIRVFWALRKAGYRITDKIVMITRYNKEDKFEIEKDLTTLNKIQKKLHLFQREIISIYEPVDEIIKKLVNSDAKILWSTPSIVQIIANRLKEKKLTLNFPIIFFTSENIIYSQKELFTEYIGKKIVNLYGSMESPSLGFDFDLVGKFIIFPNSNLFQFGNITIREDRVKTGNVIISNLINKTMPIIRFDLNDIAEIDENPDFGFKFIKKIIGRKDDILRLSNGQEFAHHHAHEMFMDFHECEMFKFIQKRDKSVRLQLKISNNQNQSQVEKLAYQRWEKRFREVPLIIEFVEDFKINADTGKFKNIEIE